jgi:hypothetical protein
MTVLVASVILLAATAGVAPVHVTVSDLAGTWVTISGDCRNGQHLLEADGKCRVWCFDSISDGEWSLRGGNEILIRLDPKTSDGEIITVTGFERYSDHTVLDVVYHDGRREKWMKE